MSKAAEDSTGGFPSALDKTAKIMYNEKAACWTVEVVLCPFPDRARTVRSEIMEKAGAKKPCMQSF
jgi:hypothetical protein